jgi:hypothetical protein
MNALNALIKSILLLKHFTIPKKIRPGFDPFLLIGDAHISRFLPLEYARILPLHNLR